MHDYINLLLTLFPAQFWMENFKEEKKRHFSFLYGFCCIDMTLMVRGPLKGHWKLSINLDLSRERSERVTVGKQVS